MSHLFAEISVVDAVGAGPPASDLGRVLGAAAGVPEVAARLPAEAALTVRLTGDEELRRLNREFLGEDGVTDVLSFPSGSADGYLGDIAVSWPAALRQAAGFGHPVEVEAALLCVHGLLHLLGWDHASPAEETEMWRLTRAALAAGGVEGLAAGRL